MPMFSGDFRTVVVSRARMFHVKPAAKHSELFRRQRYRNKFVGDFQKVPRETRYSYARLEADWARRETFTNFPG